LRIAAGVMRYMRLAGCQVACRDNPRLPAAAGVTLAVSMSRELTH
jgi:hypothetical protein